MDYSYVLRTWRNEQDKFGNRIKIPVWRVIKVTLQKAEELNKEFKWLEENEMYNVGAFLIEQWGAAKALTIDPIRANEKMYILETEYTFYNQY